MVAEVVIAISDTDIEGYTAIQLSQILLRISAVPQDEVHDVKVAEATRSIVPVLQSKEGHR